MKKKRLSILGAGLLTFVLTIYSNGRAIMKHTRKILLLQMWFWIVFGVMLSPYPANSQQLVSSFQTLPTNGARNWESFTIGEDTYLAVANMRNNSTYNIDSRIYQAS